MQMSECSIIGKGAISQSEPVNSVQKEKLGLYPIQSATVMVFLSTELDLQIGETS